MTWKTEIECGESYPKYVQTRKNHFNRGNELAEHIKNEIYPRELFYIPSIKRYKLYRWLRDVMEQLCINIIFESHIQRTFIVTRNVTELWSEHVHTPELEFEENNRLITRAECQLPGNHGRLNYPQDR